jgi:hypothetical protein
MAVEEVRARLRLKLEEIVGSEETSYLMDRPPGGWSDLVTNQTLTDKLDALRQEMRAEISDVRTELAALRGEVGSGLSGLSASVDQRLRRQTWIMTTALLTGMGAAAMIATLA